MNTPEAGLDDEDMRQRCAAHSQWMTDHPPAVKFAEDWADLNLDDLARRSRSEQCADPKLQRNHEPT
jgi:hypothetical protein